MEQKIKDKYTEMFKDNDLFHMKDIMGVNHKPHPFMIGNKHVKAANEGGGMGILSKEVVDKVGCDHKGCNLSYDEHTFDTVMFLQLKRNGTNEEANKFLKSIADEIQSDGIDGFAMVETDKKFRITEDE